jgi:Na+/melibiose symporter-like transporter
MNIIRAAVLLAAALLAVSIAGCDHFVGKDAREVNKGVSIWLALAAGGGVLVALGIATALNTPKEDQDKRGIGIGIAFVGVVLAILGVA